MLRSTSFLFGLFILFLGGCQSQMPLSQEDTGSSGKRLLVCTGAQSGENVTVQAGMNMMQRLGIEAGWVVTGVDQLDAIQVERLASYDALVLMDACHAAFSAAEGQQLVDFVEQGGSLAAMGRAAAKPAQWDGYAELLGAVIEGEGVEATAEYWSLDPAHPATSTLPVRAEVEGTWFDYAPHPRGISHVLTAIDERSYSGGNMGYDHPLSWAHHRGEGRVWYTGLGTDARHFDDLSSHFSGGLRWVLGLADGDVSATLTGMYQRVVLDTNVTFPMQLEIAPDGRVFYIEREGGFKVWDPQTGRTVTAGYIPVQTRIEDGLLGLALDPAFEENRWIYLYYSPISMAPNRLSRFTMNGNEIDLRSEKVLLEVPTQREYCCHSGGGLEFASDGTLFLSTGDNTAGAGINALDERPGWAHRDAQRSTANTNDLRGKILRIRPMPDGTYTIPEGNLFEADDRHRGEIYTMGHRSPFRIAIDQRRGWLYWGDVGPGTQYREALSPTGYEEFNQARGPGFFGWPYFIGPNDPYRRYDFETDTPLDYKDPNAPLNGSPNNTGAEILPPAQPAFVWYNFTPSDAFPMLGAGGMSAMAGPTYYYDAEKVGPHGFPAYFDGQVFFYEWMRNWVKTVRLDEEGDLVNILPFAPEIPLIRPTDMKFDSQGRMYVLEWGTDFWGSNRNGQLVRIDYLARTENPLDPGMAPPDTSNGQLVVIDSPPEGSFVALDAPFDFTVSTTEYIDAATYVSVSLWHDTHEHKKMETKGRKGQIGVESDFSHGPYTMNHYIELEARIWDDYHRIRLNPRLVEAEHFYLGNGARRVATGSRQKPTFADSAEVYVTYKDGGWATLAPAHTGGLRTVSIRIRPNAPGRLRLSDASDPTRILVEVPFEDAPDWMEVTMDLSDVVVAGRLKIEADLALERGEVDLDWLRFE